MARGDTIRELDEQMATLVRRAVDDLRVQMRRRLEEATTELQRRLGEAAPELPESFISEEHVRRIADEVAGPKPEALDEARAAGREAGTIAGRCAAHGDLRAAFAGIDRARSQADVLGALIEASLGHADRAAVLLLRDGRLAGWGGRGFESDDESVRRVDLAADQEPWAALASGGPPRELQSSASAALVSQLDSPLAHRACAIPLVLRDRVAAVIYADRVAGDEPLDVDGIQVLGYVAALALETLAFRDREFTSTLRPADRLESAETTESAAAEEGGRDWVEPAPVPPAGQPTEESDAAADPAPDLEAPEEDGPVREVEELDADLDEAELYEPSSEAEFELADAEPDEEAPAELVTEVELEDLAPEEAVAFQDEPGEIPIREYDYPRDADDEDEDRRAEGAVDDAVLEEAPELEEEGFEEAPELEEEAVEPLPSAETVAWSPQAVPEGDGERGAEGEADGEGADADAAAGVDLDQRPEAGAVPPPAPTPPSASGPVEPPADVEGPGWAFAAPKEEVAEGDEAAHEEARRLARLLVSEIQLYNQDEVDEGRRNRDIYERLRDDIDRSRQLYEERVEPEVRESTDYFYQELVRQLAAGDAKALGI